MYILMNPNILIVIIICIVIIIFNAMQPREGFTPMINKLYRPHIRNARLYADEFINQYSNGYVTRKLKKYGLY